MGKGRGSGGKATCQMVLTLMMTAAVMGAEYRLRRGHEPFIYKNIVSHNPKQFPFEPRAVSTALGNEMKMLLGMCKEDRQVLMTSLPAVSPMSITRRATQNDALNILENMVEVMEMEQDKSKSKDKMLPALKKMVDSVNSTIELQTKMAPQTTNPTLIRIEDTVLKFLAISGIDVVLPLDCGKNPKRPEDPLNGRGTLPWVAALGSSEDGRFHYRCTGVLITKYHILTDGDCVSSSNINVVMMNVTDAPGSGAVFNFVTGRRIHPAIKDSEDLLSGNNIGILELALPYEFNDYIQPICLPGQFKKADPNERSEVTIVGYEAKDLPTRRIAGLYKWSKSPTLGFRFCFLALRTLKKNNPNEKTTLEDLLTENHICVDRDFELVGKSVILKVDENTGRTRVVGLGGVANAAKTNPIAYTLVQPHRFWVELVLRKFRDNTTRKPVTPSPESEVQS